MAVTDVESNQVFTIDEEQANNCFQFGTLEFTTGANAGIKKELKANTAGELSVVEPFPFDIEARGEATAVRGCNREFGTCIAPAGVRADARLIASALLRQPPHARRVRSQVALTCELL